MPGQKGRKRVRDRRRERRERVSVLGRVADDTVDADGTTQGATPAVRRAPPPPPDGLPSPTARATGFMIAIITAFIAALMIYNAATGDSSGRDAVVRVLIGAGLIVLSAFVALLVLAPAAVRNFLRRNRDR